MNIQAEKLELMRMILETDAPDVLITIRKILKKASKVDFWDTLPQSQKDEILKGIEEVDNGEVVNYEDVMKKHR